MLLQQLYTLGFFTAILSLAGWFFYQNHPRGRLFQILTLAGFGVLATSVLLSAIPFGEKLGLLFRDLSVIGVTALVFRGLVPHRRIFVIALAALLLGLNWYNHYFLRHSIAAGGQPVQAESSGELLVEIREGVNPIELQSLFDRYDLQVRPAFNPELPDQTDLDDYLVVDVPDRFAGRLDRIKTALNKTGLVDWVEENEVVSVDPQPARLPDGKRKFGLNDPGIEHLWSFEVLGMDQLYDFLEKENIRPVKKALIAILDTGVDGQHEDLKSNYQSINGANDNDPKGHGTHCAGIAGAVSNNGVGIASYSRDNAFTRVSSIKVLNSSGFGSQQTIIKGIIEAADRGADVISLSLGGRSDVSKQRAYEKAIKYANEAGAIVVAAAGNSNRNAKEFAPVSAKGIIGVSAIDEQLNRAVFSNFVSDIEMGIAAPGTNIYSTIPGNKYASYSGTSMATPYVSGLIGLMRSIRPDLSTTEAFRILNDTGKATRSDRETGRLIQPYAAVKALVAKR